MQERLLELLVHHSLSSPEQLGALLSAHPNVVRNELKTLLENGSVERINPRSPDLAVRALFYPTPKGARQIVRSAPSAKRLAHLWFVIERVYHVRNLFLVLRRPFQLSQWQVELDIRFRTVRQTRTLLLHGVGVAQVKGSPTPFAVEWDTGLLVIEPYRLACWVEWLHRLQWQDLSQNERLPILLIVARDPNTLMGYYARLRAVAQARRLGVPQAYLTVVGDVWRNGAKAPIWYSTRSGSRVALFAEERPANSSESVAFFQAAMHHTQPVTKMLNLSAAQFAPADPKGAASLIALKRELTPQTKRVLNEVAAHPMLGGAEIAELLQDESAQVWRAVRQLSELGLIKPIAQAGETRYVISEVGIAYLAAVNGLRRLAKSYARARGWTRGLNAIIRHWEHTRIENQLFLQLARQARERQADLEWLSETESRLYYGARGRRWSFLPDGAGTYQTEQKKIHLAVEIERSRMSVQRLRTKLTLYCAYLETRLYRDESRETFRILFLTTTWARADKIRRVAHELARIRGVNVLPLWLSTITMFEEYGIGKPIWRRADTWQWSRCLEDG